MVYIYRVSQNLVSVFSNFNISKLPGFIKLKFCVHEDMTFIYSMETCLCRYKCKIKECCKKYLKLGLLGTYWKGWHPARFWHKVWLLGHINFEWQGFKWQQSDKPKSVHSTTNEILHLQVQIFHGWHWWNLCAFTGQTFGRK